MDDCDKVTCKISERATDCDLYEIEDVTAALGGRKLIRTGLVITIPEGLYGQIAHRCGLEYAQVRIEDIMAQIN